MDEDFGNFSVYYRVNLKNTAISTVNNALNSNVNKQQKLNNKPPRFP